MKVNMNDTVTVKLTDHGLNILEKRWRDTYSSFYSYDIVNDKVWESRINIRDNGMIYRTQLHNLMSQFGQHIGMGLPLCFETEFDIMSL
ncbi:hypothetical protein HPMBJEAJ_00085 [Aeromonas phage avDM6]|nr:hypothetical protein HPMBJEAJ_00085 [Aeromonas phage avDM6]